MIFPSYSWVKSVISIHFAIKSNKQANKYINFRLSNIYIVQQKQFRNDKRAQSQYMMTNACQTHVELRFQYRTFHLPVFVLFCFDLLFVVVVAADKMLYIFSALLFPFAPTAYSPHCEFERQCRLVDY